MASQLYSYLYLYRNNIAILCTYQATISDKKLWPDYVKLRSVMNILAKNSNKMAKIV